MRLLLDTHVFLWFAAGDEELSSTARALIEDPENDVYVSIVSAWEASIKFKSGKLEVITTTPRNYFGYRRENLGIALLNLTAASIHRLQDLPLIHHDPFDHMLVCQAQEHGLTLITRDKFVLRYPVATVAC